MAMNSLLQNIISHLHLDFLVIIKMLNQKLMRLLKS